MDARSRAHDPGALPEWRGKLGGAQASRWGKNMPQLLCRTEGTLFLMVWTLKVICSHCTSSVVKLEC